MVNNNGIPFEVKKPFETVYELKNEVPSFEEFMKDYQVDENLNYNDLNSGNIGEVKGYGPCSDHRCYGSNKCLDGESFYELYTPCPAERCPNKGKNIPLHWVHNNSGCGRSRDLISNKARIRCPDCFNTSHMKYHRFACSAHKNDYRWTSSTSFDSALFMVYKNSSFPVSAFMDVLAEFKANPWDARDDN